MRKNEVKYLFFGIVALVVCVLTLVFSSGLSDILAMFDPTVKAHWQEAQIARLEREKNLATLGLWAQSVVVVVTTGALCCASVALTVSGVKYAWYRANWRGVVLGKGEYMAIEQGGQWSLQQAALPQAALPQWLTVSTPQQTLDAIAQGIQHCLVYGSSGAGKSNILDWLNSHLARRGDVLRIDPHGQGTIGQGRNYAAIEGELSRLVDVMQGRYQDLSIERKPLWAIVDEWLSIVSNTETGAASIKTLLTEGRKAQVFVVLASQSNRAKPLGLDGSYDILDGLTVLHITLDAQGNRTLTANRGDGQDIPLIVPGIYQGPRVVEGEAIDASQIALFAAPQSAVVDAQVVGDDDRLADMLIGGASLRKACTEVYGHTGGAFYDKAARVRDRLRQEGKL